MNPFFYFKECLGRAIGRKKTLIIFGSVFLLAAVLGMIFVKTPSMYTYHQNLCDRFVDRVCYSDTSVFFIFVRRWLGHGLLLLLVIAGGIHPATMPVPVAVLAYRAYTFGGSLVIFFQIYGVSGALVVFVLFLPIHLLIDGVLLFGTALSVDRCCGFCCCKRDLFRLLGDFLCLLFCIAVICLLEMILLLALFHPIGNIL